MLKNKGGSGFGFSKLDWHASPKDRRNHVKINEIRGKTQRVNMISRLDFCVYFIKRMEFNLITALFS